jgi:hypothetical protein
MFMHSRMKKRRSRYGDSSSRRNRAWFASIFSSSRWIGFCQPRARRTVNVGSPSEWELRIRFVLMRFEICCHAGQHSCLVTCTAGVSMVAAAQWRTHIGDVWKSFVRCAAACSGAGRRQKASSRRRVRTRRRRDSDSILDRAHGPGRLPGRSGRHARYQQSRTSSQAGIVNLGVDAGRR